MGWLKAREQNISDAKVTSGLEASEPIFTYLRNETPRYVSVRDA